MDSNKVNNSKLTQYIMGSFPRNYIFLLLIGNWTITCGADNIVSILAPEGVAQGTALSVEVSYVVSTDRDILIIFQRNKISTSLAYYSVFLPPCPKWTSLAQMFHLKS